MPTRHLLTYILTPWSGVLLETCQHVSCK